MLVHGDGGDGGAMAPLKRLPSFGKEFSDIDRHGFCC